MLTNEIDRVAVIYIVNKDNNVIIFDSIPNISISQADHAVY